MEERIKIKKNKLLFTEGKDDKALFEKFLDDLNISDVQVEAVNGIPYFIEILSGIFKLPKFSNVVFLGIIRDAEKNEDNPQDSAKNAYTSIFNILKKSKRIERILGRRINYRNMNTWIYNTISIGIFITCKPGCNYGMLEDLCLNHVQGTMEMRCVEKFLRCVRGNSSEENYLDYFKNPSKNKILAYLASQEKVHGSICVAADRNIWTINDPSFNKLKNFLEGFRGSQ